MTESQEFGQHQGLGIIEGEVTQLQVSEDGQRALKVPQVGWNQIRATEPVSLEKVRSPGPELCGKSWPTVSTCTLFTPMSPLQPTARWPRHLRGTAATISAPACAAETSSLANFTQKGAVSKV